MPESMALCLPVTYTLRVTCGSSYSPSKAASTRILRRPGMYDISKHKGMLSCQSRKFGCLAGRFQPQPAPPSGGHPNASPQSFRACQEGHRAARPHDASEAAAYAPSPPGASRAPVTEQFMFSPPFLPLFPRRSRRHKAPRRSPSPPSLTVRLPWLLTAVYNAVQSSTPWLRGRSRSWPAVIRRAAGPPPGVHSYHPVGGIRGTPPGPLEYQISRPAGQPAGDSSTAATCQACRRRGTGRWPGPAKASWWMRAMPWWARRRGPARAAWHGHEHGHGPGPAGPLTHQPTRPPAARRRRRPARQRRRSRRRGAG
jgi:hypothetical protein